MTPELRLTQAIIWQAVDDLFAKTPIGATTAENGVGERREALSFLTESHGAWAQRRAELCSMIDLDPDLVRAEIVAILDGATPRTRVGNGVEQARALWAEQNAPKPRRPKRLSPSPPTQPAPQPPPKAPRPSPPPLPMQRVRETIKAEKWWKTPPRAPEDDWLYDGIELPPDCGPVTPCSSVGAPPKAA